MWSTNPKSLGTLLSSLCYLPFTQSSFLLPMKTSRHFLYPPHLVLEKHFIIYISIISIAPTKNNESNNFYFFYKARFPPYVFVIGKVNIKNIFKNSKAYIPNKKLRNIRLWMNRVILFSRLVPFSKTSGYFHVQQCPEKGAVFLKDYNISWFSKWT